MRQLFVMRHVEASSMKGAGGDISREITASGRSAAATLRDHFAQIGYAPDAVISSTAERTRQTAEIVCSDLDATVDFHRRLYLATQEELVDFVRDLSDDLQNVLLIGHNNGISDLVTFLTGAPCSLRTGGLAKLNCTSQAWSYSMSRCLWRLEESWHPAKANSF